MNNLKVPVLIVLPLILLLFLHTSGMANHLYLNYWFYDIIVHFLGGICITLSAFYLSETFKIGVIKNNPSLLIVITLIAGILWEVFEVQYGIAGHPFGTYLYYFDSIKDLIDDTLGSIFVWIFLYMKNRKSIEIQ